LKWEDVEVGEPGEGEILVKHKAIGVNFIDVYYRKGVYKAEKLPFIPGMHFEFLLASKTYYSFCKSFQLFVDHIIYVY
jgi:hypothetical protein